jgi:perosamine synthetase
MIPIYIPYLNKYKNSAMEAINTNWISNYGIYIKNSEELFKKILNVKHCILMNNGTAATHSLLLALKFMYSDIKKIYVPNNVFIAAWNCVLMEYDKSMIETMKMDPTTLNIDTSEEYIKSLDRNACVFVVHNLGNIVNVPRLKRLRPDIIFIEDNCEGMFGKHEDIYSGVSIDSLCSSCSFYGNKTLTTGEGGAFFTNNTKVYEYIKSIYSHGMTTERYIHNKLAYNYRMTNIQAGFLYDQLNDLDHILTLKENLFKNYDKLLEKALKEGKIIKLESEENTIGATWMYCIVIPRLDFKSLEEYMNNKMIQIRPFFYDIRRHDHLKDIKVDYPEMTNSGIMLPSYPGLKQEQQEYIVNYLNEYIKNL